MSAPVGWSGITAVLVLALYLAAAVASTVFAWIGTAGLGLANPEDEGNIFSARAPPIMGPAAILLSLATLSSCAASLQSTMISPARSLLAMGHHGVLSEAFTHLHQWIAAPWLSSPLPRRCYPLASRR